MSDITEREIGVFVEAVNNYFVQITGERAEIRSSFLMEQDTQPPIYEFTGLITVGGNYHGCIYFSTPRVMLTRLLLEMNELDCTNAQLLDTVGEVANTVAGNGRKYFGEDMEISVPASFQGPLRQQILTARKRPYVIMIDWRQYTAAVVVDIARK
jgi:chemotaxis protein CheX